MTDTPRAPDRGGVASCPRHGHTHLHSDKFNSGKNVFPASVLSCQPVLCPRGSVPHHPTGQVYAPESARFLPDVCGVGDTRTLSFWTLESQNGWCQGYGEQLALFFFRIRLCNLGLSCGFDSTFLYSDAPRGWRDQHMGPLSLLQKWGASSTTEGGQFPPPCVAISPRHTPQTVNTSPV